MATLNQINRTDIVTLTDITIDDVNDDMNTAYSAINAGVAQTNTNTANIVTLNAAANGATKLNLLLENGTDADHDIDITADILSLQDASTSNWDTTLTSVSVTPAIDASDANGLDTGSVAIDTWYSAWAIYNPTTETTAGLFSLSTATPNMPIGYTKRRRVGWVLTDGSSNILAFNHVSGSDWFIFDSPQTIQAVTIAANGIGTFSDIVTVVPSGTRLCRLQISGTNIQHDTTVGATLYWTAYVPGAGGAIPFTALTIAATGVSHYIGGWVEVNMSSTQQVAVTTTASAGSTHSGAYTLQVNGWFDNA